MQTKNCGDQRGVRLAAEAVVDDYVMERTEFRARQLATNFDWMYTSVDVRPFSSGEPS